MGLDERKYQCASCGLAIDRDLNTAINPEQLHHLS
jgi:transposase